jgi:hypothetical protein
MELSDIEKEKIIQFNKDEVLVEAVRKVLLATIYSNGTLRQGIKSEPIKNAAFSLVNQAKEVSNEELGADLRALWAGVRALELGLQQLATYKDKDILEQLRDNPAV